MLDGLIRRGPDLGGALDIDVHDHVLAPFQKGMYFGAEGAVVVSMDFGVLEESAGFHVLLGLLPGQRVVVLAIDLALAGRSGGAGD